MYRTRVRVPAGRRIAVEEMLLGLADATSTRILGDEVEICGFSRRRPDAARWRSVWSATGIPIRSVRLDSVPDDGWAARSLVRLAPARSGRFVLRGSHLPISSPTRHDLCINAGPAFGTGHHPTTSVMIEMLDRLAGQRPRPRRVLDLGTGAGTLAIVMARLWRCPVLAIDNDPDAVACARDNVARNRVGRWVEVVEADARRPTGRRFDVVAANLFADLLRGVAPHLAGSLSTGGSLVLSGILLPQRLPVLRSYVRHGLTVRRTVRRETWITLLVDRSRARR